MATLNTFGFTPRKGRSSLQRLPTKAIDSSQPVAFTQPFDLKPILSSSCNIKNNKEIQTRKTSKKANKKNSNKITHYFNTTTTKSTTATTAMDIDVEHEEEEKEICCVIRKKLPFASLLNDIEQEYAQELLVLEYTEQCRKRRNQEDVPMLKRQKTIDTDLSDVMNQYLNIKSRILHSSSAMSSTKLIQLYTLQQKEEEDLSRTLRCKMSVEESNLFVSQMTNEYLS